VNRPRPSAVTETRPDPFPAGLDAESRAWVASLQPDAEPKARELALASLHVLLIKAAQFELGRRRASLAHIPDHDLDEIVVEAANDSLVLILKHLNNFAGRSRFSTWAYKFAITETAVRLRKRAWARVRDSAGH